MDNKSSMNEQGQANPQADNGEELLRELANVFSASLGVGAALAKTVARATAGGRPVPEPETKDDPVQVIVHYGVATMVNVVGAVMAGVGEISRARTTMDGTAESPAAESEPAADRTSPAEAAQRSGIPAVHPGATLRIPLSIENTGAEAMTAMRFACLALEPVGEPGDGQIVTPAAISFDPAELTVAPRDFEKLTVYIRPAEQAAPGRYRATLGLAGGFQTELLFEVLPQIA